MSLEPSILLSDYLVYLLVAFVVWGVLKLRSQRPLREAWKHVFSHSMSTVAFVVLLSYVAITLLDSFHFQVRQNSSKGKSQIATQKSLFDFIWEPLGEQDEKTYSAPFATRMFVKSLVMGKDGKEVRTYAPLKYAGLGLSASYPRSLDILMRILKGIFWGLFISLTIIESLLLIGSRGDFQTFKANNRKLYKGEGQIKWRSAALTFIVLFIFYACLYQVSRNYHIFGTSQIGQDILYRAIKSIRTGLLIGTLTTLFILPFSLVLGSVAGYFGGLVDDLIGYLYTTISSIPSVLLISASILVLQVYLNNHADFFDTLEERADARLLILCLVLGLTSWAHLCRLLRGETLKIRELSYIRAAKSLGTKPLKIISSHILPNIMHIVLITMVIDFSGLVLAEAILSYVGVGVDPTTFSWGNMINSSRLELARQPIVWWPLASSLFFMFVLILSANIFADAVRDAFDPKLKNNR